MQNRHKSAKKRSIPVQPATAIKPILPPDILAGIAIIAAVALIVYMPCLSGGFVLDDDLLLTNNRLIKAPDGLFRFWCTTEANDDRPASNTTLWLEWRLWGMNSTGYHVTNLMLHVAASLLIWLILRKLSIPGAFLAGLIFAVHPVNVESVAWIAQRKNLMAMLFFLLSIVCYLKFLKHALPRLAAKQIPFTFSSSFQLWNWLSLAVFALAMLSKGSVAVLPLLLLLIVWWRNKITFRDVVQTAPFFLVAVVLTAVNVWFQRHGADLPIRNADFTDRLLGAGGAPWFYLYKAMLPLNLVFIYPQWRIQADNPLWWLPLLSAVILTVSLWAYRGSWSRPFLFAWCFFCIALLPAMGFTDVGFMQYSLVADRYQHIAIIGVIGLASAGYAVWRRQTKGPARRAANAAAIVLAGVLAILARQQSSLYRDGTTLYQETLKSNANCLALQIDLGMEMLNNGKPQEAIKCYQEALRIKPDCADALNNLGYALKITGNRQQAIANYNNALRLKPNNAETHVNLGAVLYDEKSYTEAIEHYKEAIRLAPGLIGAYYNMGQALEQIGKPDEAIKCFKQVLQLEPDNPVAPEKLAALLSQTGRPAEAIAPFKQALRINPDNAQTHQNLGNALLKTGRTEEAIQHYQMALRLKPDFAEAHNNWGIALAETDQLPEAIQHFKQAVRLKANYINAYKNMASAYAKLRQPSEALDAAHKALDIAHSEGQTDQVKEIENWLLSHQERAMGDEERKEDKR